jgi:hypothetical protein
MVPSSKTLIGHVFFLIMIFTCLSFVCLFVSFLFLFSSQNIRTAAVRSFSSLIHDETSETNPSEAFVSAGMIYRIPFQVERPGCILHWKFKTDPRVNI